MAALQLQLQAEQIQQKQALVVAHLLTLVLRLPVVSCWRVVQLAVGFNKPCMAVNTM